MTAIRPITFGDVLIKRHRVFFENTTLSRISLSETGDKMTLSIGLVSNISFSPSSTQPDSVEVEITLNDHRYSSSKPIDKTTELPTTISALTMQMDLRSQIRNPVISADDERRFDIGLTLLEKWIRSSLVIEETPTR